MRVYKGKLKECRVGPPDTDGKPQQEGVVVRIEDHFHLCTDNVTSYLSYFTFMESDFEELIPLVEDKPVDTTSITKLHRDKPADTISLRDIIGAKAKVTIDFEE